MRSGTCKMCLQMKPLVRSHLIPAAMYDYCREKEHRPIRMENGVLIATDRQTQDFLLCQECEDVLNRGGEMWIAGKLATWKKTFPLHSDLTAQAPAVEDAGLRIYFAAKNPDIEADKLIHLALGIFWKASVHSWRGRETDPIIELGSYADGVRRWLRGEKEFPTNVHLLAEVFPVDRAQAVLIGPYEGERAEWRRFLLHLPGLSFTLNVGKTVDDTFRWLSQDEPRTPHRRVSGQGRKVDAADCRQSSPVTKDRILPACNAESSSATTWRNVRKGTPHRCEARQE